MSTRSLWSRVLSLVAENDGEAGWDLLYRQPSRFSEIINSGEINEQVGQDEVTDGQKQFRDGEEYGMKDTDADACSETEKLTNYSNDLLNMIWKTMQEEKIEQERNRQETEEKQETNRMEDKERLEQLIKRISEDAERMKEIIVKKCEDRASKLAADISNLENKTQHSIVEVNNKMQSVENLLSNECHKPSLVKLLLRQN